MRRFPAKPLSQAFPRDNDQKLKSSLSPLEVNAFGQLNLADRKIHGDWFTVREVGGETGRRRAQAPVALAQEDSGPKIDLVIVISLGGMIDE